MSNPIKCAIYARYSSVRQRPASIEDQIRVCKRFAAERGWLVLDAHIYIDKAISADLIAPRDNFKRMLSEAASGNCEFSRILVDDTSRVARNTQEALEIFSLLSFYDVHVNYVTQGIDTANETAEDLITINGLADSRYLKMLARETHRGIEGRVLNGFSGGGRRYGYRTEPVFNGKVDIYGQPEAIGYKMRIIPDEADTVIRIFRMFAEEGMSGKKIAKILNKEYKEKGAPVPPNRRAWTVNTVQGGQKPLRGILNNELYIGRYFWNKTSIKKSPEGKRKIVLKDRSAWRLADHPELRIIPDDLWAKAQERRGKVRKVVKRDYWKARNFYTTNLLTGILKCGRCGGNIVIIYGGKYGRYGCANNFNKGAAICPNGATVKRAVLDTAFAGYLESLMANPGMVRQVHKKVNDILKVRRNSDKATWRKRALEKELRTAEREIKNVEKAILSGFHNDAVKELLNRTEQAKKSVMEKLAEVDRDHKPIREIPEISVGGYIEGLFNILQLYPAAGKTFLSTCFGTVDFIDEVSSVYLRSGRC